MKIIPIFENRLYSAHYEGDENSDEFEKLFDSWQDPQFLEDFFNTHEADLKTGFFGAISVQDAVIKTKQEAARLEQRFLQLAASDKDDLDSLFRPLHLTFSDGILQESKAKGDRYKSWLRIYAIKIDQGVYVVTGGAIKLTRTMNERQHTKDELGKVKRCQIYLKQLGIDNIEGLNELILE